MLWIKPERVESQRRILIVFEHLLSSRHLMELNVILKEGTGKKFTGEENTGSFLFLKHVYEEGAIERKQGEN